MISSLKGASGATDNLNDAQKKYIATAVKAAGSNEAVIDSLNGAKKASKAAAMLSCINIIWSRYNSCKCQADFYTVR